jgi:O-antigen biosynthesis protein
MSNHKISIIIPIFNCIDYTEQCITSIIKNTIGVEYELVLIDNGSDEETKKWLEGFNNSCCNSMTGLERLRATLIRNDENLGFPKAVNQGIAAAGGDTIVILNNDVIVSPDWLTNLLWHLGNNNVQLIGPCTNSISGPQQTFFKLYQDEKEFYNVAIEFNSKKRGKMKKWHRLVAFCLVFKSEVVEKIGTFDEGFSPGNFEDDDFCIRAIYDGFKCGIAEDVLVHHFGSVTHKAMSLDYEKLLQINKQKFDIKWSREKYIELARLNNGVA